MLAMHGIGGSLAGLAGSGYFGECPGPRSRQRSALPLNGDATANSSAFQYMRHAIYAAGYFLRRRGKTKTTPLLGSAVPITFVSHAPNVSKACRRSSR